MSLHLSESEGRDLIARCGGRAKVSPSVAECLAKIKRTEQLAKAPKEVHEPCGPRKKSAGERAYGDFLETARAYGIIQFWRDEPWFLPLADGAKYRPDFFVVLANGHPAMVEIKGSFKWRGSFVKHKVARSLFPEYLWICLEYKKGAWRLMFKTGREPLELLP